MMVRIRTIVALTGVLATASVFAQPVQESPGRVVHEPPAETVAVPHRPEAPPALRARVAALTDIVEHTSECYAYHGERSEHAADPRCGRWYAALTRGGVASAYAIGEVLLQRDDEHPQRVRNAEGEWQRGPRLVQVLAATGARVAVPYLLLFLKDTVGAQEEFAGTDREALRALARLTGYDAAPSAPWQDRSYDTQDTREVAVANWIEWWRSHREQSRDEWIADGERRCLDDLASEEPVVRFAAMQRLVGMPVHRGSVVTALRELMARRELPAPTRVALRRWAQRSRIALGATNTLARAD